MTGWLSYALKDRFCLPIFNLLSRLTALKNVQLPLTIADTSEEALKRAKEMLRLVGLETRINHKPSGLSGGEHQRVAIAKALINNSKIILADKPTGSLDIKLVGK